MNISKYALGDLAQIMLFTIFITLLLYWLAGVHLDLDNLFNLFNLWTGVILGWLYRSRN